MPSPDSSGVPPDPSHPPHSEAGNAPLGPRNGRFGRVGVTPWSFLDTLRGLTLTLVPWFAFLAYSQLSAKGGSAAPKPLSRGTDVAQGIAVLIITALVEGVFLIAPLYFALGRRSPATSRAEGLRALGFRAVPFGSAVSMVAGGIVAVLAVTYLYGVIVDHFKLGLQTNVDTLLNELHAEPVTVLCTLFGAVFIAPFCEEIFFRGFAFAGLLRGMNAPLAALLSAVLFTAAHGDLGSSVPLFILGLILAYLRWRSGSIWPTIALHASNNLIATIFVLAALIGH
jgi:CAAX protease family protein